jgi:elongation factor 1 alpha-like protein
MGHLLLQMGFVDKKTMNRYEKDSQLKGKGSFMYAWVLDEQEEERDRGVTIDVAVSSFETKTKKVTLLDSPGHRDFVPNMITGAAQADAAVLVLNSDEGAFETGFKSDGQTKEHILLAKSLGVDYLIVAVNKLDLVEWSEKRYQEIVSKTTEFLVKSGYKNKMCFVPISGFTGENLTVPPKNPLFKSWYNSPTLVDRIDEIKPPKREYEQSFRFIVSDVYKDAISGIGVAVGGRIEGGFVAKGDKLLLMPLNQIVTVKMIKFQDNAVEYAYSGHNVDIGIIGVDISKISLGSVLCDPQNPVSICSKFQAQILTFSELPVPILRGTQAMFHIHCLSMPATISKLLHTIDKRTGSIAQKNPKCIGAQSTALVVIELDRPICLELYSLYKQLGRFTLRDSGKTIGGGIITSLNTNTKIVNK